MFIRYFETKPEKIYENFPEELIFYCSVTEENMKNGKHGGGNSLKAKIKKFHSPPKL